MNVDEVFSGKWHSCAGGYTLNSRKFRFDKSDSGGYVFDFVYKYDSDDTISMHFEFTADEIVLLRNEMTSKGTTKFVATKNKHPFTLEFRIISERIEMRFEGFDMVWPGHPQHFIMSDFQAIV